MSGSDQRFWKVVSVGAVVGLFVLASAVHELAGRGPLVADSSAQADFLLAPGMDVSGREMLFTHSADGKTIYLWSFGNWLPNNNRTPVLQETFCADLWPDRLIPR